MKDMIEYTPEQIKKIKKRATKRHKQTSNWRDKKLGIKNRGYKI